MFSQILWIDANVENQENSSYIKELESRNSSKVKAFKNIFEAIKYMEKIKYEETKVIISGRLYPEFVKKFKENINNMRIAPKIIVFTGNKEKFLEYNKSYENNDNKFYSYGGIATSFEEIQEFLKEGFIPKISNKSDNGQFIFEYIDNKEKLMLPLFFKSLIDNTPIDSNIDQYTNNIYNTYSKQSNDITLLLNQIKSMPSIPIEILAKYYARLFTCESGFYRDINQDLRSNNYQKHLPYIKVLYEGVKIKSLPLPKEKVFYRGSKLTNLEINKIKDYSLKKIKDLPCSILFVKTFMEFTKNKDIALKFLQFENKDNYFSKVLFILEKDDNLGYSLSTHCDLEQESYYQAEKPVLFFPLSAFEIKYIKEMNIGKEKGYEIRLLYLGRYIKEK